MNEEMEVRYDVPEDVKVAYRTAADGMQGLWHAVVRLLFERDPRAAVAIASAAKQGAKLRAVMGMTECGLAFEMQEDDGTWRPFYVVLATRQSLQ